MKMFEGLSDRLQNVVHKIKGYGKLTEDEIIVQMADIDIYWYFIVIFKSLLFFI